MGTTTEESEVENILYYLPTEIPRSVRIISEALGIDTTIIPNLHPNKTEKPYFESLLELSKNPAIDHVFVVFRQIFCDDFREEPWRVFEMDGELIDLCESWEFHPMREREELLSKRGVKSEKYRFVDEEKGY